MRVTAYLPASKRRDLVICQSQLLSRPHHRHYIRTIPCQKLPSSHRHSQTQRAYKPGLSFFSPRPLGFGGMHTTSIASTKPRFRFHSRCSAYSDLVLMSSVPQKRIRSGSLSLPLVVVYQCRRRRCQWHRQEDGRRLMAGVIHGAARVARESIVLEPFTPCVDTETRVDDYSMNYENVVHRFERREFSCSWSETMS